MATAVSADESSGIFSFLSNVQQSIEGLPQVVSDAQTLQLETNILPPIPLSLDKTGQQTSWLSWVRPTIKNVPLVGTIAPYGEASGGVGTFVFFGVAFVFVLGLLMVARAFRRR